MWLPVVHHSAFAIGRGPRGQLSDGHKKTRLVSTASIHSPQRCPTPPQDLPAAAILCKGLFVVGYGTRRPCLRWVVFFHHRLP